MGQQKRTISQEAFDAAVKENQEEFDMEAEEAVRSAVEEFKLQGVDLTGIICSANGAAEADRHPAAQALAEVEAAAADLATGDVSRLEQALRGLQASVTHDTKDAEAEALGVAAQRGAAALVLRCLGESASQHSTEVARAGLGALAALLAGDAHRAAFEKERGALVLERLLKEFSGDAEVAALAAEAAEQAATKHEGCKCALYDYGFPAALLAAVAGPPEAPGRLVAAACRALRRIVTADDNRPTTSRAFQMARGLAGLGAPLTFLAVLRRTDVATDPALAADVCEAVRRIAATEEICKEFADEGGVDTCMQVLERGLEHSGCAKSACAVLRQLANSDAIKAQVVAAGGLKLIIRVVGVHSGNAKVVEQALGLLTNLTLRNPEAAEEAADSGCVDCVLEVIDSWQGQPLLGDPGSKWVQRQACMSIRNIVARRPELRPAVLGRGAEPLLRAVKAAHPSTCGDVGAAALRDLGIEDYNS